MCSGATWKREVVPDHKFDFVDTREFTDNSVGMRFKYLWLYIIILKDFLVYVSDIFTAITMLSTDSWSNSIFKSCPPDQANGCVYIPFEVGKWLFFGCICFSFLLLAYEGYKAKKIIASRDISYAFTNVMANNYYSLRSYDHFCFFSHISNSTKRMDDFAFFVFFTFKSWKRLLLADGPRQSINALTLYGFYLSKQDKGEWYDLGKYFDRNDLVTSALTASTAFTVLIFAGSLLLLITAGVCYIPLLCHIRGNLKEYCCHKVDKRITEIIKRRNKQRLAKANALARKEAAGDYSHLKDKNGDIIKPTLPSITLEDDFNDTSSIRTKGPPPSTFTQSDYYYNDRKDYPTDYPPMPAYQQSYANYAQNYNQYNPSMGTLPDDQMTYDDDYGSTAHLTGANSAYVAGGNDMFAPNNHYDQNAYGYQQQQHQSLQPQQQQQYPTRTGSAVDRAYDNGIAYDDSPAYADPSQQQQQQQQHSQLRPQANDPAYGYQHGTQRRSDYSNGDHGAGYGHAL